MMGRAVSSISAWIVLSAVAVTLSSCAHEQALQKARTADELHDFDVAVAQYAKILRDHPDDRDAALSLQRSKLRAAEAHMTRGRRLFAIGKYDDAVMELQLAADLNPTSEDAERALREARAAVRAKLAAPADGRTALQTLLSRTRDLPPAGYELPDTRLAGQVTTGRAATSRDLYVLVARMANLSL